MSDSIRVPEKLIDVRVAFEMLPDFLLYLPLLRAKIVGARHEVLPRYCVVRLLAQDVPEDAEEMSPSFTRTYPNGDVDLADVRWRRRDGSTLPTTDR